MRGSVNWIWLETGLPGKTNRQVEFRRTFPVTEAQLAGGWILSITADSRYRLKMNGRWVNDGPFRAWPEHYLYDRIDLSLYLQAGENRLEVQVTSWGVGNFQYVASDPGLCCVLEHDGKPVLVSDGRWQARPARERVSEVVRFGCQLGFEETFDARLSGSGGWEPVNVIRAPQEDGHRNLSASPVRPLSRIERPFASLLRAEKVRLFDHHFALRRDEVLSDSFGGSGIQTVFGVFSTRLICTTAAVVELVVSFGFDFLQLDGREVAFDAASWTDGFRTLKVSLAAGEHRLAVVTCGGGGNISDILIGCFTDGGVAFVSPVAGSGSVWAVARLPENADAARAAVQDEAALAWRPCTAAEAVLPSASFAVRCARVLGPAEAGPLNGLTVAPGAGEALRLLLDLGEMSVGFPAVSADAAPGARIEGNLVENIEFANTGREWIQQTANKMNGFRLICGEGRTDWVARERRGGRYLQLTVSQTDQPVVFHSIALIESTYAAEREPQFRCSDALLNQIHRIGTHTLKLCMEDTFTDCPTYEQVTWIGDARNEALFNYYSFGAQDVVQRTLQVGAESLGRMDLVCCMGPAAGMDASFCELPSWSFLWGVAVWEHYLYGSDRTFLTSIYSAVRTNLSRALARVDETGLFRGAGMFDWTPIDHEKPYVTHSQMFLCRALECGARCAETLGHSADAVLWQAARDRLAKQIHTTLWVPERNAYADSLDADGTLSAKSCQHTSALGLLYDIVPEPCRAAAIANLADKPDWMTGPGSPFAMFFFVEAYHKLGMSAKALELIRDYWGMMVNHGATTFWEMVDAEWLDGRSKKPTRSHCHGWSCAPLDFFGRVILGVTPLEPGFSRVLVAPQPFDLTEASGVVPTPHGGLCVSWTRSAEGFVCDISAPDGVEVVYAKPVPV